MVALVDIANRALSAIGTRSSITSFAENSNEAEQCNLLIEPLRDELLRMAPWNCATNTDLLTVLKAAPGTPENPTTGQATWTKAIPPPPWAYEYAMPSDCLRLLWVVPQFATGFAGGVPITTAITGSTPTYWNGPPVRFKVAIDQDDNGNDIKVILTNQEQAILTYIKRVMNPDVWDVQFQQALVAALAARLVWALVGAKELANEKTKEANSYIALARQSDGNEGLTINDVTPDWIRVRGIIYPSLEGGPSNGVFDWGPMLTMY